MKFEVGMRVIRIKEPTNKPDSPKIGAIGTVVSICSPNVCVHFDLPNSRFKEWLCKIDSIEPYEDEPPEIKISFDELMGI